MITDAPVFLCGMPRSATTWLGRRLDEHHDAAVFGESDFWARSFVEPGQDGRYGREQLIRVAEIQATKEWAQTTGDDNGALPDLPSGRYPELVLQALAEVTGSPSPGDLFLEICNSVQRNAAATVVIEKTPGHLLFQSQILAAMPDSRFIVVYREPLGFVASLTHRSDRRGLLANRLLRRLAYHPAITVVMWRRYARAVIDAIQDGAGCYLFVDHADVRRDPASVVKSALSHIGLVSTSVGVDSDPVNSSFKATRRLGPPRATSYWLGLLARREVETLYPHAAQPDHSAADALVSWLLLLPGAIAFALYAPRPTKPLAYAMNIVGRKR